MKGGVATGGRSAGLSVGQPPLKQRDVDLRFNSWLRFYVAVRRQKILAGNRRDLDLSKRRNITRAPGNF